MTRASNGSVNAIAVRLASLFIGTVCGSVLLLTGCAGYVSPDYYKAIPTPDICQQIWASPSYNVNNVARYAELDRRQTSCGDPPVPKP
jgi:hypothetical protein